MKIAICGIRGVPANYGGFETFAEELGKRLVERGHRVTVYGRYFSKSAEAPPDSCDFNYLGMRSILLPAVAHKYFETPLHTLRTFFHLELYANDVVLLCNGANSPFAFLPRLAGLPVVINVDGIERDRKKWNSIGRLWYRLGEYCSCLFASKMISDASFIQKYYLDKYATKSTVLRYGARIMAEEDAELKSKSNYTFLKSSELSILSEFGLEPGSYLLYVSRLEPENNAAIVIEAYKRISANKKVIPLVIVGDAPYATKYKSFLRKIASEVSGENVLFLGYQFGHAYEALQRGAYVYVQATEVGGTHPALVEAMGFANCVVANNVIEHREVVGDAARLYSFNSIDSLSEHLQDLCENPIKVQEKRLEAYRRSSELYCWESITTSYEELLRSTISTCNREGY